MVSTTYDTARSERQRGPGLSSAIWRVVSRFNRAIQRVAVFTYELLTGRF